MDLSTAQLTGWMGQLLWPLFRVAGLLLTMPIIGSAMVPAQIRLVLALVITLIIVPLLPAMPAVEPLSTESLRITLQQILIGGMGGLLLHIYFAIFAMAGQMVSLQMGLGMAMMYDPVNGVSIPIIAQIYQVMATLMFLAIDGHLVVINILVSSFTAIPVGMVTADTLDLNTLTLQVGWALGAALLIALPAITTMLLVNIAFGVMNRAAPQLNVFSLGFPMSMMAGLIVLAVSISGMPGLFTSITEQALALLSGMIGSAR
ncbi:flagellar biosynthetic protein FliR [Parendozoicomonas haliclonae]|uniref:Flagellar biosynthetic protein FliR n=1 Tax=Parendozoicomonas haliclonae TaxID=1960125 RepID=A0A1X7AH79_9GAMM|nr:flagellar biosynthetic protein FliR [Parendozoicomonas haliclonae]SMA39916.1 Flagellar biosynthetic protein FliR [Parendozoicomonas haliclonae]